MANAVNHGWEVGMVRYALARSARATVTAYIGRPAASDAT